jgi:hypothetical protein
LERILTSNRKVLAALLVALVLPVTLAAQPAVGASPLTSAKSLAKDLLPSSFAEKVGFTKVVQKATTSSTGVKSCPTGAQEEFVDASGKTGVEAEVVACTTVKAASAILGSAEAGTSPFSSPPRQLGSSAAERRNGSTYAIYWQRGKILELVVLSTAIPASSSSSTSTTTAGPPLTEAQQKILSQAASKQDSRLG